MAIGYLTAIVTSVLLIFSVNSIEAYATPLQPRQAFPNLTVSQIDLFTPYTWFASAAYCPPNTTLTWACGTKCNANSGFLPTAAGGDGSDEQYWYVGFDPTFATVIVAHQGTNPDELMADLIDGDFFLEPLNQTLFPGISPSIMAHNGFQDSHARSAPSILTAVKQTLAAYNTETVTMVGHSLGAALAVLDSVFLPLHLPLNIVFTTYTYGLPRVGNEDFANYIDANATLTHVNNKEDPIPILPGMFLGFHHPAGEVHIQDSGVWTQCPGQDNPSTMCIVGDVPTILQSNETDHDGPYNGILMGNSGCQ